MPEERHESGRELGELNEQAAAVQIVYEANPKHKRIRAPAREGSLCPRDADGPALLRSSDLVGKKRYATDGQTRTVLSGMTQAMILGEKLGTATLSIGMKYLRCWSHNGLLKRTKIERRTVRRAKRRREQ